MHGNGGCFLGCGALTVARSIFSHLAANGHSGHCVPETHADMCYHSWQARGTIWDARIQAGVCPVLAVSKANAMLLCYRSGPLSFLLVLNFPYLMVLHPSVLRASLVSELRGHS